MANPERTTSIPLPALALVAVPGRKRATLELAREATVWGEEEKVLGQLRASGAHVRDVSVPTLEEAVVTLVTSDQVPQ